jgi:hypothetical protein
MSKSVESDGEFLNRLMNNRPIGTSLGSAVVESVSVRRVCFSRKEIVHRSYRDLFKMA